MNSHLRNDIVSAITYFPSAVTEAHKRQDTPPHCIFAIDNLIRKAVNEIMRILSPGMS